MATKGEKKPNKPAVEEKKASKQPYEEKSQPVYQNNYYKNYKGGENKKFDSVVILINSKEPKPREMDLGAWNENLPKKEALQEKAQQSKAVKRVSFSNPIIREEARPTTSEGKNGEQKPKPMKEAIKRENGSPAKQEKVEKNGEGKNIAKAKKVPKPRLDLDMNLNALIRTLTTPSSKKLKEFLELPYKEVKAKREEYLKGWHETLLKIIRSDLDYSASFHRNYSGREVRIKLSKIPSSFCSLLLEGRFYHIYNGLRENQEAYVCVSNFKTEGVVKQIERFCKKKGTEVLYIDRSYSTEDSIWITVRGLGRGENPFKFPEELDKINVDISFDLLRRDLDWYEDRKTLSSAALVQKKINIDNVYADSDLADFTDYEAQYLIAKRLNTFYNLYEHGSVEKFQTFKVAFLNTHNGMEIKKWLEGQGFKVDNLPGGRPKSDGDARASIIIEIYSGIKFLEIETKKPLEKY